jgi:hypothetical protein
VNSKKENSKDKTFIPITSKNSASDLFNFLVQFSLVDLQKSSFTFLDYKGSARQLKFTSNGESLSTISQKGGAQLI